ncbi:MAG: hypothetical protein ACXWVS_07065 [Hyphomicrobium sp.]
MLAIVYLLAASVANLFKSRRRLEAEILFLRHQVNIAWATANAFSASGQRSRAAGVDDPAVATPARYGPGG